MTAALLCPGPSLGRLFDDDFAGLRVGVNRAATAYACEVWACLDYPLTRDEHPNVLGNPLWLTRRQTFIDIGQRVPFRATPHTDDLVCPVKSWTLYTATCALVYLATLGATDVKVYGADWKPDARDFDNKATGENRSEERFRNERVIWDGVVAWMNGNGIKVERITDGAA